MKLIALAALAGLMLAGCGTTDARQEPPVAESRINTLVPGMAERIEAARRPSTQYWRNRAAITETRTIRCRTDVYSNFSSTHCN